MVEYEIKLNEESLQGLLRRKGGLNVLYILSLMSYLQSGL